MPKDSVIMAIAIVPLKPGGHLLYLSDWICFFGPANQVFLSRGLSSALAHSWRLMTDHSPERCLDHQPLVPISQLSCLWKAE